MKLRDLLFTASALCLLSGQAYATPITFDAGTPFTTNTVIDKSTGADLDGIMVTACFVSSECQTVSFDGSLGNSTFGAAIGDGWQLSLQGDSFIHPFSFDTSVAITQLHLNGAPGHIVFDTKAIDDNNGAPGSQYGTAFQIDTFGLILDFQPVDVIYSNRVFVDGMFYGDLYTSMTLNFASTGVTGKMQFYADTDIASTVAVPAPATMLLMLAGLAGLRLRRAKY
jgi:hypothetical protein